MALRHGIPHGDTVMPFLRYAARRHTPGLLRDSHQIQEMEKAQPPHLARRDRAENGERITSVSPGPTAAEQEMEIAIG